MRTKDRTFRFGGSALSLFACLALGGCAGTTLYYAPVRPPGGIFFISTKAPLTTDFAGNPCGSATKKVSHSETFYFRDFIFTGQTLAWDEAAIGKIAREGGIEEISFADYELLDILGIFGKFTINVYGN